MGRKIEDDGLLSKDGSEILSEVEKLKDKLRSKIDENESLNKVISEINTTKKGDDEMDESTMKLILKEFSEDIGDKIENVKSSFREDIDGVETKIKNLYEKTCEGDECLKKQISDIGVSVGKLKEKTDSIDVGKIEKMVDSSLSNMSKKLEEYGNKADEVCNGIDCFKKELEEKEQKKQRDKDNTYICANCKNKFIWDGVTKTCPNCSARFDI